MQGGGTATATSPAAVVHTAHGDAYFLWTAGVWRPLSGVDGLEQDSAGWTYRSAADETVWRFGTDGTLHSRTLRNGWAYTYGYANGRLAEVTNAFGRKLLFDYDAAGQLVSVTTPDAGTVGYTHESARLASVAYSGGAQRYYLHEDSRWPSALTGIVDEIGNRWANFAYDATGRAILTEHAGGADRYLVSYLGSSAATVTDPLNTSRTYSYARAGGRLAVTASTLPSGKGAGDAAARQQNEIGLVLAETDFLGVQTFYTWDLARQLKLAATQAAGRPEAQTSFSRVASQLPLARAHHRSRPHHRLQLRRPGQQAQRNHHRHGYRPGPQLAVDLQRPGPARDHDRPQGRGLEVTATTRRATVFRPGIRWAGKPATATTGPAASPARPSPTA